MRQNSFSVFLNIVLGLLLLGSIIFSYFFGNFGGISLQELNNDYLIKQELSFSDLPKEIQKKYINRDNFKQKKETTKVDMVFDDDGNPVIDGVENLRNIITNLQERISYLENENMVLATDKNELLKIVEYEKSKNSTEQKSLLSNNLEKINEAEKQHYQNISELTRKINDLHKENIDLSQKLNQKEEHFKDTIEDMKKQLDEERKALNDREQEMDSMYQEKVASINDLSKSKQQQINELQDKLKSQYSSSILKLGKKDQKISLLQNKINNLMIEKNSILTKNSQEIMKLEREHSKKLQEFNEIVKNSTQESDLIKEEYKKTSQRVEKKYTNLLKTKTDTIDKLKQKLEDERQNSIMILSNSEQAIIEKEKILDKRVKTIKEQNRAKVEELKRKIVNLESELKSVENSKKIVSLELKNKEKKILLDNDKILQLQDKIKTFEYKKRDIDSEVNTLVLENEKKHNKNYKILNEKIALLELEAKSIIDNNKKVLSTLSNEKIKLIDKLNSAREENTKKENKIYSLKKSIELIEKKKDELELSEQDKLSSIRKSFDNLKATVSLKEKEYEKTINELTSLLKEKENKLKLREKDKLKLGKYIREITALKKTIKKLDSNKRSSKLKQLGKVECGDMVSGNFKISPTCKAKVDKFLSKYNDTYYFEVIPIIGTGGFASLNKVQRDKRLGISDSEIKRLTRLSNIGLGRDRAKEGGWLIRDKFGDNVKISYAVYSIKAKDKRGFVIRVYR
jgi:hypothetical protein